MRKTRTYLALTTSAALLASFGSQAIAARIPLELTSQKLSSLSAKQLQARFTLKNAKGDVIVLKSQQLKKQDDLWATLDPKKDGLQGTSTDKAYQTFNIPGKRNEVIVAVIDSGVDISHEDLRGKIWTNSKEIPGNGIDDDNNGYVDDIHGWNFLGNAKGENINSTTLEVTREYARMKKKAEAGVLSADDQAYLEKTKSMYEEKASETNEQYAIFTQVIEAYKLLKANGLKEETEAAIAAVPNTNAEVVAAKSLATRALSQGFTSTAAAEAAEEIKVQVQYFYNLNFNPSAVIGDNPEVMDERGYGNPNVTGPDSSHGTHVSGIIAANRNQIGIDGQARNVKIMSIRAVPDGDERDKDVANAIRYAVDNGARVINMSFGKPLSPNKDYVDAAMKYAEAKGVLLVHAAGNDNKNTEAYDNNYPNARLLADTGTRNLENWIEVGASSRMANATLPASFSNWGKTSVDLFAPGHNIVSSVPGNKYAAYSGTSMASPEVAGIAALMLNVFPFATATELKSTLMETTTQYPGLMVNRPGESTLVSFDSLSVAGGVANAYKALVKLSQQNVR